MLCYNYIMERWVFMIIETFSAEETEKIGKEIGEKAQKGQIYTLNGDLGAGKTAFAKGFAKGLGIKEHITSPTFTIINEYSGGRLPFYHFDIYRISDADEFYETGYEEYFYGEGVCLVEWAEILSEIMPKEIINIKITKNLEKGENYRIIEVD